MIPNQELSLFFKRIISATRTTKQVKNDNSARYFQITVDENHILGISYDGYAIAKAQILYNRSGGYTGTAVYDAELLPVLRDIFDNRLESLVYLETEISGDGRVGFEIQNERGSNIGITLYPINFAFPDWQNMIKKYRPHQSFVADKEELKREVYFAKKEGFGNISIGDALVSIEALDISVSLCDDGEIKLRPIKVMTGKAKQEPYEGIGLIIASQNFSYLTAPCVEKENVKIYELQSINQKGDN